MAALQRFLAPARTLCPVIATNGRTVVCLYWGQRNPEHLMAAAVAQYASTQAHEQRGPSPWMAALLTVLTPGLGHIYIGQARRGVTLFLLVMVADTLLM